MSGINPIGLSVQALQDWLLSQLPARVVALNATRAAALRSLPGPFVIPSNAHLTLGADENGTKTEAALTSGGAVTASTLATDVNNAAVPGVTASVSVDGCLVLTAQQVPTATLQSQLVVFEDALADGTHTVGANAALGFSPLGAVVTRLPLKAPTPGGVVDGWPNQAPDYTQGFWVMIDDREARPVSDSSLRRDEWLVKLTLYVMKIEQAQVKRRTREALNAAMQAVTDVLLTTAGRYLGRQAYGDVLDLEVMEQTVEGRVIIFDETSNVVHDAGTIVVGLKVFQRPTDVAP